MKKILFLLVLLFPVFASAQKLVKNEVDRFTKQNTKATSYETIWRDAMFGGMYEVAVKLVDGEHHLAMKLHDLNMFSISEGDKLFLLLDNDSSLVLPCIHGDVASPTKDVWHASVVYGILPEYIPMLMSQKLTAIRIDRSSGYVTKNVKPKHGDVIAKELLLVK